MKQYFMDLHIHIGASSSGAPVKIVGPRSIARLIDAFGSEMNVLHQATEEQLRDVVSPRVAENIILARTGQLTLLSGGGGRYGKAVRE